MSTKMCMSNPYVKGENANLRTDLCLIHKVDFVLYDHHGDLSNFILHLKIDQKKLTHWSPFKEKQIAVI